MNIIIRQEVEKDYKVVENVVEQAFLEAEMSDHKEHELVARLRSSNEFIKELSLVDLKDEQIIGYVLFTKIKIGGKADISLALAPVSVLPELQNKSIGKMLIEHGLDTAQKLGYESVIVLGHEAYYPKFGFKKANLWGIKAPFEVPDEAFMALELVQGALSDVSGIVEYSEAFFE